jgi:hypothetical protein
MSQIPSQPIKRTHLSEKDAQMFFERENWATLVANRVENWPSARDNYGRNYATLVLYQSQGQYLNTIQKLIEGGLPVSNSLFFDLPHQVGAMDNTEAIQTIEYFKYLQSLNLDITSVDEYGNNLFTRLEKSFNGAVFHYLLDQKIVPDTLLIARLIALIDEETHEGHHDDYMNHFYHHQALADNKTHNEALTDFVHEYLAQHSELLDKENFDLFFNSFKLSYNKLMDVYGNKGVYQVTEAMALYHQQPLKDINLFYPAQIKIIQALELVSGRDFLAHSIS